MTKIIVVVCVLMASCRQHKPDEINPLKPFAETTILKKTSITPELSSFGNISFLTKVDITSTLDGKITGIFVEEGDAVRKGRKLAQLENIQLMIQREQTIMAVNVAESSLNLAETRYREGRLNVEAQMLSIEKTVIELEQKERELKLLKETLNNKKQLFEIGGITEESLKTVELNYYAMEAEYRTMQKDLEIQRIGFRNEDILNMGYTVPADPGKKKELLIDINTQTLKAEVFEAETKLESAKAELKSINALIDELTIYSPINGIFGGKNAETGESVKEGAALFSIFDSSEVYVIFNIQETSTINIKEGLKVNIIIDAFPDKNFQGTVYLISPTVDPQTGNIAVRALLDNSDGLLRPGMFARVKVIYDESREAILIPETAILKKQGNPGISPRNIDAIWLTGKIRFHFEPA